MKPDYGFNLWQSGLRKEISHNFYDIPIDHLSRVTENTVSTMANIVKDGVEYAVSFDMENDVAAQLLSPLPRDFKEPLSAWLANPRMLYQTIDFPSAHVIKHIEAQLGPVQTGQSGETFVPFLVRKIA